jgi:hypothetical protein
MDITVEYLPGLFSAFVGLPIANTPGLVFFTNRTIVKPIVTNLQPVKFLTGQ